MGENGGIKVEKKVKATRIDVYNLASHFILLYPSHCWYYYVNLCGYYERGISDYDEW